MLEMREFVVQKVSLGDRTFFDKGSLTIDVGELQDGLMSADARIQAVRVSLARPGEETRIVCVKDVIEPRVKAAGGQPGAGILHLLKNVAVVTCGPIVGFQEGIMDMSGPGAEHTPFSSMLLVVLQIEAVDGITAHQHEEIVRTSGLRAAEFLCQTTVQAQPDELEHLTANQSPDDRSLPRLAYVYMVLSQGLLHDTHVLGCDAKQGLPQIIDPVVLLEGAIVSGNYLPQHTSEHVAEVLALIEQHTADLQPQLLLAGPAFLAGRYGMACGAICQAAQRQLRIPAVTAMFPENPGVESYRKHVTIVRASENVMGMKDAIEKMTLVGLKLVNGEEIDWQLDGTISHGIRRNYFA